MYFLPELLVDRIDSCLLSIWTCEAVSSCWLGTRVSSTFLWVSAWIWSSPFWLGLSLLTIYCRVFIMIYSASCSPLQPTCHWESAAALTRLEGRLPSSGSCCLGLWLAASRMDGVLCPLLMLPSLVPVQALLPLWPSGVLPGEQSLFLCTWDWGQVWKMGSQLECWHLECLSREELEVECWLNALGSL